MLRGGTELAYSAVSFNGRVSEHAGAIPLSPSSRLLTPRPPPHPQGDLLATVGSYPDFMLTIWDWRNEGTILRSKAFSQEVFNVSFSPNFEGFLTTSGTGHIRFWKMASTFTGLKLQGQIGKFGAVELSDIAGYCELPDGKAVAGTEAGSLLLWDSGLIKASRSGRSPCTPWDATSGPRWKKSGVRKPLARCLIEVSSLSCFLCAPADGDRSPRRQALP